MKQIKLLKLKHSYVLCCRFADLFGLDLSEIKTICDDIPKVPKSAFQDLKNAELSDLDSDSGTDNSSSNYYNYHQRHLSAKNAPRAHSVQATSSAASSTTASSSRQAKATPSRLQPLFTQPSGTPSMLNNLRDRKVSLESAYVDQANKKIKVSSSAFFLYTGNERLIT